MSGSGGGGGGRLRVLIVMVCLGWLATGCQLNGQRLDSQEHALLQQCLETQQVLLDGQQKLLLEQGERLLDIRQRIGDGPALSVQLGDLESQLAALDMRLGQDCPIAEPVTPPRQLQDKLVVGELEDVLFHAPDLILRARIDTGATTSSLHARDIQTFERDGATWVRFVIRLDDHDHDVTLERPRARRVRIVQATAEEPDRREVVEMRISVGAVTQTSEFTLTDRSGMEYPVLIGRNVLRDLMVVDVAKIDAAPPPRRPSPPARAVDADDAAAEHGSESDPEAAGDDDGDHDDEG